MLVESRIALYEHEHRHIVALIDKFYTNRSEI